ncbi:MAG: hypothetical protein K2J86_04520 [Prevotella sp.]|nr:hypothetical protein [Prevotella sp.]
MQIFIKQTIDSLLKDLGYEEWDDVDEDALLFQQGYNGYVIEVEDGEIFEIPEETEGQIIDEDTAYYMNIEVLEGIFAKEEIEGILTSGLYKLKSDLIIPEEDFD